MEVTFKPTAQQLEVIKEFLNIMNSKTYEKYRHEEFVTYCSDEVFRTWWFHVKDVPPMLGVIANKFLMETGWYAFIEVNKGYLFIGKNNLYHPRNGCSDRDKAFRVRLHFLEYLEKIVYESNI